MEMVPVFGSARKRLGVSSISDAVQAPFDCHRAKLAGRR